MATRASRIAIFAGASLGCALALRADEGILRAELVFPLRAEHNHAPSIVECPNGDLLASWYRGSGERRADDVAVFGARRRRASAEWSDAFLMVDTPGFPDGNTAMHVDDSGQLWLFWPVIIANTWESCQTNWLVARDSDGEGAPRWSGHGTMYLRPANFVERMRRGLDERRALGSTGGFTEEQIAARMAIVEDKLAQRLGWQTRCKPTLLPSGRILLPLYSDTYDAGLMAISDDRGATWRASEPLAGYGSIQPAVCRRRDGTLVAYMRENGPLDKIRVAESSDDGESWGAVDVTELPNPGSGVDALVTRRGSWIIIYNDTTSGRQSLAVSISDDEGRTWAATHHLERHETGSYHYPAIIEGKDGRLHAIYSYFVAGGKSMKHAEFDTAWIRAGD